MRQRIDNLEGLVKKLIAERQQPPSLVADAAPTPALEGSRPEEDLSLSDVSSKLQDVAGAGKTVMDGIHSVYVGGDDWYAVLQEVGYLYILSPQCLNLTPKRCLSPPMFYYFISSDS